MLMPMKERDHPLLYEINTRVWLRDLGQQKKGFTLAHVPDSALDEIASLKFDLVWLMGVWQTGEAGRVISRSPSFFEEYKKILPDLKPEDIIGSPYAVQEYSVSEELGGPEALAHLRSRLAQRGIGLILDFVPNHTARDHLWVYWHPDFYIQGDEESLRREPENFFIAETVHGKKILAHGHDPYFPAWSDTAQLNYLHPEMRASMIQTLGAVASQCDGVRCDMSMLILRETFLRLWEKRAGLPEGIAPAKGEFWAEAIDAVRRRFPEFIFIAEAYWNLEPELHALGFEYTYDKPFYDSLIYDGAGSIRELLKRDPEFQARSVHFLENHDEARSAHLLPADKHRAAALICYATPGMRFFHEGQLDGRKVKLPIQLARRPSEPRNLELREFYEKLLAELARPVMRQGKWRLLEPRPVSNKNQSWEQFVIHRWDGGKRGALVVAVNYAPQRADCLVPFDLPGLQGRRISLCDLLTGASSEHDGASLRDPGFYLELAPYEARLFSVSPA